MRINFWRRSHQIVTANTQPNPSSLYVTVCSVSAVLGGRTFEFGTVVREVVEYKTRCPIERHLLVPTPATLSSLKSGPSLVYFTRNRPKRR